ncbi:MAG: DNA gyrase/topoisomerase IV subunit A [Bacteroidia bacterium]
MSEEIPQNPDERYEEQIHDITPVSGLYENWFLEYASYVILERAVPAIEDGLKPVQRRILHAMKVIDDGRFNKVANIIGQTMQYHPHGDAAIGDAMVGLGQKDLLIETQGNWGDVRTGDSAAAARYIEARLSKFALEVAFNGQTTRWQTSYDGRKKEPISLPMKFPLVLAQGVEGIAVGLSTKILPHNFIELIEASIKILKKQSFELYPDFQTGGLIDVTNYNEGMRGGKIRCRARIEEVDKKTLLIKEIPFGTTTTGLIESIVKANDANKIKIKKVIDNTARDVEIEIQLPAGVSPDITIDALYAFTDCETSISPNACVIVADKPRFMSVKDMLRYNTQQTMDLLKWELEIKLGELLDKWHFSSLEKIFIENRIYRDIEECETWEAVLEAIDKGLEPHKSLLMREVVQEDIIRLTEIKIKRISKFDSFKADEQLRTLEEEMEGVKYSLEHLNAYTISYYEGLLKRYGKGRERKTEIRIFDTIQAAQVAVASEKLYVNRSEGFVGYGMKKDEYVVDCSPLDDIIVFRRDGKCLVTKVSDKAFVGKDILHVDVFKKNDDRMTYHLMYVDGKTAICYGKRFNITAVTRDKEYDLTKGEKNSKVIYFSANPNSESEVVTVYLSQNAPARKKIFDFDFGDLAIKGRGAQGNTVTKYTVKRVLFKEKGRSTLGGRKIWYDEVVGRLNVDERGRLLGAFDGDDAIICIFKDGSYELTNYELSNRYEPDQLLLLEKWNPKRPITALHYVPANQAWYVKRFLIETSTLNKRFAFISEDKGAKLAFLSSKDNLVVEVVTGTKKKKESQELNLTEFIDVKGWRAIGNKLTGEPVLEVKLLSADEPAQEATSIPAAEVEETEVPESVEEQEQPQAEPKPGTVPKAEPVEEAAKADIAQTAPAIEVGTTIEFDVKKEREQKGGDGPQQLSIF